MSRNRDGVLSTSASKGTAKAVFGPEHRLQSALEFLKPYEVPDLIRIGNAGDGGYLVPASVLESVDALVSLGVGEDWSVEESVHRMHPAIPIHSYDYTIGASVFAESCRTALKALLAWPIDVIAGRSRVSDLPGRYSEYLERHAQCLRYAAFFQGNRIHFRERIFNRRERAGYVTMDEVFGRIPDCRSVFLKMDIEGDEYRVVSDILRYADRLTLLAIEFHDTEPYRPVFAARVKEICTEFRIVHVHGNNYSGVARDGLPETLEITFARRHLVTSARKRDHLPLEGLDMPNDPTRPDLILRWQ